MKLIGEFRIIDILYTDNGKGEYKTSKVGKKYDNRRNRDYKVFLTNVGWLDFLEINEKKEYTGYCISTTYYVDCYVENGYMMIETSNSIYKCKVLNITTEE